MIAAFKDNLAEESSYARKRQEPTVKRHRGNLSVLKKRKILLQQSGCARRNRRKSQELLAVGDRRW